MRASPARAANRGRRGASAAVSQAAAAVSSARETAGDLARHLPSMTLLDPAEHLLANVRTGRFERMLSGMTAAGSLITAAEIFFEHDRASFGNRVMWWPVILGPVGAAAGVAGVYSERLAKTALPLASLAIVANGIQGTYLHVRGIAQKPGGFRRNARFNIETGPPLLAPLLMTLVGGMGLVAAVLRRER